MPARRRRPTTSAGPRRRHPAAGGHAAPERLVDLSGLASRGVRAASFELARKGLERAALEELAAGDRDLLQELLERFAAEYAASKRRESAVDFEDLQLAARDLLRDHEPVRDAVRLRFRLVMVDEFQDTNRLQCELIELAAHPEATEVFTVGDEFQSIYGFRHADVEVFRERRAQAENLLTLRSNYRSRPQVLAAVNYLFAGAFGDEYQPLAASAEFADPVFGHPVELLVRTRRAIATSGSTGGRARRVRIAARVRELVDAGEAVPGEIVVLFAAGTDAERYEEELRREGLPTYRATGRGYFGQQQVADLLAYLRLLHNRYDDVALATVLASPFVGVSNDALVLVRRGLRDGRSSPRSSGGCPRACPPSTRACSAPSCSGTSGSSASPPASGSSGSASRSSRSTTTTWPCSRAGTGPTLREPPEARAARPEYEAIRGGDLAGFVRFVREQARSARGSSRRSRRRREPMPFAS